MKILFIDPHLSSKKSPPPLNLVSIMTVCSKANHDVKRIAFEIDNRRFSNLDDFYTFEKEFCETIGKLSVDYDIFAVTTTFSVLKRVEILLKTAKRYNPKIKTVIGGGFTHYLLLCNEWLMNLYSRCPSLDYIVIGEGEETIIELLNNIQNPANCQGIIYQNSNIKFSGHRKLLGALDLLPLNSYSNYDLSNVSHLRILASRGCPYSCAFCEVCVQWGGQYRIRSESNVVSEIESIIQNFNIRKIRFADSTFTLHPRLEYICDKITKMNAEWVAYARVSDITDRKLEYMKKSGCKGLYFGIETASNETLEKINKKITPQTIKNVIKKVQHYGIKVSGTMILGFPHEILNDIKKTMKFAKDLNLEGYSWHRYMHPVESIIQNPTLIKKFDWRNFETDIPYELIPELVWRYPEVSEDMHVPIILAELRETNLPNVPINSNINLPEYVKLLMNELDGYMSECAQQNEVRVMNSTVERMLS